MTGNSQSVQSYVMVNMQPFILYQFMDEILPVICYSDFLDKTFALGFFFSFCSSLLVWLTVISEAWNCIFATDNGYKNYQNFLNHRIRKGDWNGSLDVSSLRLPTQLDNHPHTNRSMALYSWDSQMSNHGGCTTLPLSFAAAAVPSCWNMFS